MIWLPQEAIMTVKLLGVPPASQTPLEKDRAPLEDLSCVPNDADDKADEGMPTTDHDATGWEAIEPVKP